MHAKRALPHANVPNTVIAEIFRFFGGYASLSFAEIHILLVILFVIPFSLLPPRALFKEAF